MATRKKLLFLQLPQLDNDTRGDTENVPLAAAYLRYAAERAGESAYYGFSQFPESAGLYDNRVLVDKILQRAPDVIACTLYLWNIERTLRVLRELQQRHPGIRILLGGPEAAYSHPFLFEQPIADAIAVGEGEVVFPALLHSLRTGIPVDFSSVALRTASGYQWGRQAPSPVDLSQAVPHPGYKSCRPDAKGMAYLETSRGCPMRCTYCRYPHLRQSMSFLSPERILEHIQALQQIGAREIRFVDPTFNAHPRFREILEQLASFNRAGRLSFFAELNAGRLTDAEAALMKAAHFAEIEVGVQSRNAKVLDIIRRPTSLERLDAGIQRLICRRIKVTVDVMYGLPLQNTTDVRQSVAWALTLKGANVQCLQTLLLPGTELRDRHHEWNIHAMPLPPYAVTQTSTMNRQDFQSIEALIARNPKLRSDVPTFKFAGRKLDLFPEQISIQAPYRSRYPGRQNRRAFILKGTTLFAHRQRLADFISGAIKTYPDNLFQFVLAPNNEEPLDLLDDLIAAIRQAPTHLIDRYAAVALGNKIASRRLMIQLPGGRGVSRAWADEAEALLASVFF